MRTATQTGFNKKLIGIIAVMIAIFPIAATGATNSSNVPIDVYLQRVEKDISKGVSGTKLHSEIKSLLKIKQNSSVFFIPEINYITGRKIENVPPSAVQKIRQKIINTDIFISASTVIIVMLGVFTLIYTSDRYFSSETKRNLSILTGIILIISALILQGPLFYLVFGIMAGLGFKFKEKIPFAIIMTLFLIAHLTGVIAERGYFHYISNQKNLLYTKLERDNYAPPFLIKEEKGAYLKVASLANNQTLLHPVKESELTNLIKTINNNKLKAVLYNNLGCIAFNKGKLKEAATLFEKAENLYPMIKTYYNLFITYSSLLEPQKAEVYSKKLEKTNFSFDRTVPIVANINDIKIPKPTFKIPVYETLGLIIGIGIAIIITRIQKPSSLISINPFFSYLPGYRLYYSNRYSALLLFIGTLILIEIFIGSMLCSMNL
ncbi:tetratricopeptide repeat protein [Desulfurobacterium indicum]|uniref:Uncharacterized protein n=1 Tax=Desulfurobacterium indicum TaxID=1914305 RepID=A0A1R1MKW2_9BACT|nr:tetratricopeptide repeat protein [Desulfurobacterium indicum]OMH40445.1 hypothetical protein BLW93_05125 [Desulfurobacterium indicum]